MSDIKINSSNVENAVNEIISKIKIEIIDASVASQNRIINIIENSSGEFIDFLKEEVYSEVSAITAVGNLLISMANYIQSAADAFQRIDEMYDFRKV